MATKKGTDKDDFREQFRCKKCNSLNTYTIQEGSFLICRRCGYRAKFGGVVNG